MLRVRVAFAAHNGTLLTSVLPFQSRRYVSIHHTVAPTVALSRSLSLSLSLSLSSCPFALVLVFLAWRRRSSKVRCATTSGRRRHAYAPTCPATVFAGLPTFQAHAAAVVTSTSDTAAAAAANWKTGGCVTFCANARTTTTRPSREGLQTREWTAAWNTSHSHAHILYTKWVFGMGWE